MKCIVLFSILLVILSACNPLSQLSKDIEIPKGSKTPNSALEETQELTITQTITPYPTPELDFSFIQETKDGYDWHGVEFDMEGQNVQIVSNLPTDDFEITFIEVERFKNNLEALDIVLNDGKPARIEIHNFDIERDPETFCIGREEGVMMCQSAGKDPYLFYISPNTISRYINASYYPGTKARRRDIVSGDFKVDLLKTLLNPDPILTLESYDQCQKIINEKFKKDEITSEYIGFDIGISSLDQPISNQMTIYNDEFENGWEASAGEGEIEIASVEKLFSGEKSIKVLLTGENERGAPGAKIYFTHPLIDIRSYEWIEFQLFIPKDSSPVFYMGASTNDGTYLTDDPGAISIEPFIDGSFFAEARWQTVRMPLDVLGYEGELMGNFHFYISDSEPTSSLFIDEVRLISTEDNG